MVVNRSILFQDASVCLPLHAGHSGATLGLQRRSRTFATRDQAAQAPDDPQKTSEESSSPALVGVGTCLHMFNCNVDVTS